MIAGTEKGRLLSEKLSDSGYSVVATTSTSYGSSLFAERKNLVIRSGALNKDGMMALVKELDVKLIIDSSHPYAEEVKENVQYISESTGVPVVELGRMSVRVHGAVEFDSYTDAADYLRGKMGNVLLTIGSKNAGCFRETENQKIAAAADDVYFIVSGIPMKIKGKNE